MINNLGRELPDKINRKKIIPFQKIDKKYIQRKSILHKDSFSSKIIPSIKEVIKQVSLRDGMTISFHHHLRNGDYVVNKVMAAIASLGYRDINVAASGIFPVHAPLLRYIEDGVITGFEVNYMIGPIAKAVSSGILKKPVVFRTHGGRPRAIEEGDLIIDVAFIAASSADCYGNANGVYGPSRFGPIGYAVPDELFAKKVVIITDNLVTYPCTPTSISQKYVDYVVEVDKIGESQGIIFGTTKITKDPIRLKTAEDATRVIKASGLLKNDFSFQTGAGGTSLAVANYIYEILKKNKIIGSFGGGGITEFFTKMLKEGYFKKLLDLQSLDLIAVESLGTNLNHIEVDASFYANPHNKGCWVDQLDIMILGAMEIDKDFNVNVITGSNGVIMGGSGGHSDTAAGSRLAIVIAPLVRKNYPTIVEKVTTITTPGDTIDVLVTEGGIAVNPKRRDIIKLLEEDNIQLKSIKNLKEKCDAILGKKYMNLKTEKKIVGVVEYRDGTIIDVIRKVKE